LAPRPTLWLDPLDRRYSIDGRAEEGKTPLMPVPSAHKRRAGQGWLVVMTSAFPSIATQKEAVVQDTDTIGFPRGTSTFGPIATGRLQWAPSNSIAWPMASTTTQKVSLAQDAALNKCTTDLDTMLDEVIPWVTDGPGRPAVA
jgi:hypothetical protein